MLPKEEAKLKGTLAGASWTTADGAVDGRGSIDDGVRACCCSADLPSARHRSAPRTRRFAAISDAKEVGVVMMNGEDHFVIVAECGVRRDGHVDACGCEGSGRKHSEQVCCAHAA